MARASNAQAPAARLRDADGVVLGPVAEVDPHSPVAVGSRREKFLPITRPALMDRLTAANLWPNGEAVQARRFMRYLDYWRRHGYAVQLLELEHEPHRREAEVGAVDRNYRRLAHMRVDAGESLGNPRRID